jgi:predicted ATPase
MSAAEAERVAPLFGDLLSIPIEGHYPAVHQSSAQRRRQLLAALVDYVESLARKQPLVVFIENLHWADATTLEDLPSWSRESADNAFCC